MMKGSSLLSRKVKCPIHTYDWINNNQFDSNYYQMQATLTDVVEGLKFSH